MNAGLGLILFFAAPRRVHQLDQPGPGVLLGEPGPPSSLNQR
jgi:hypothetical protein